MKSKLIVLGVAFVLLSACGGNQEAPKDNQANQNTPATTTQSDNGQDTAISESTVSQQAVDNAPTDAQNATPVQETTANAPVVPAKAPPSPETLKLGQARYEATCRVCHEQGLLDAPKLGDKANWAKRQEKDIETLYTHSAKGFNKMPAQAVNGVSEDEVKAAVDFMLSQVP